MNLLRRSFLKSIAASPLAFLLPKAEQPFVATHKAQPGQDCKAAPKVVTVWWDGRWWRSFGSRISWTERRGIWLEKPNRNEFIHFNILPTLDWCADMCVFKDSLIWVGKNGIVWRIERTEDSVCHYRFTALHFEIVFCV